MEQLQTFLIITKKTEVIKMASLKQIKKNVKQNHLMFPVEMYNSLPGSIIITSYILNNERPDLKDVHKKFKYYKRHGFNFGLEDADYIDKVLKCFDCKPIPYEYAAFVQSDWNALICPFIDGQIMPLREDGIYTLTLRKGKVYPLSKELLNGTGNTEI